MIGGARPTRLPSATTVRARAVWLADRGALRPSPSRRMPPGSATSAPTHRRCRGRSTCHCRSPEPSAILLRCHDPQAAIADMAADGAKRRCRRGRAHGLSWARARGENRFRGRSPIVTREIRNRRAEVAWAGRASSPAQIHLLPEPSP